MGTKARVIVLLLLLLLKNNVSYSQKRSTDFIRNESAFGRDKTISMYYTPSATYYFDGSDLNQFFLSPIGVEIDIERQESRFGFTTGLGFNLSTDKYFEALLPFARVKYFLSYKKKYKNENSLFTFSATQLTFGVLPKILSEFKSQKNRFFISIPVGIEFPAKVFNNNSRLRLEHCSNINRLVSRNVSSSISVCLRIALSNKINSN